MPQEKEHFHERPLRWFSVPLEQSRTARGSIFDIDLESRTKYESNSSLDDGTTSSGRFGYGLSRHLGPSLRKRSESSPSELFYDLFFVANLSSYASNHAVDNKHALVSYISFFVMLWGTWFQVSLHDVRLSSDSILDRCAKAIQFGVVLGFAIVGANFDPYDEGKFYTEYARILAFLLMTSRLVLAIQYGLVYVKAYQYPHIAMPSFLISTVAYTSTSVVYLGLAFAFSRPENEHASTLAALYVLAGFETLFNVVFSCIWKHLDFKGTHLIERMSLLTLIIVGEGVIGLLESVTIAWGAGPYPPYASFVSTIACGALMLYFFYQLYFDNLPTHDFGTIRGLIWSMLHLPLHTALILCAEGSRLFVVWNVAVEVLEKNVGNQLAASDIITRAFSGQTFEGPTFTAAYFSAQATQLSSIANSILATWPDGVSTEGDSSTAGLIADSIGMIKDGATEGTEIVTEAAFDTLLQLFATVFRAYDIEPPEAAGGDRKAELLSLFKLDDLVLVYFLVAAGCVLLLLGIMVLISRGKLDSRDGYRRSEHTNHASSTSIRSISEPIPQVKYIPTVYKTVTDLTITELPPHHIPSHSSSTAIGQDQQLNNCPWSIPNVLRLSLYFIAGFGLALLSFMDLSAQHLNGAGEAFLKNDWVLPVVTITLFVVLVVHHLPLESLGRIMRWCGCHWRSGHGHGSGGAGAGKEL